MKAVGVGWRGGEGGQGSLGFAWRKVVKTFGSAEGRRSRVWEGAEIYRGPVSCDGPMTESWQGFCLLSQRGAVYEWVIRN